MMKQAKEHLKFVTTLYKMQWEAGRLFLHEHPAGATSWQLDMMKEVMQLDGVRTIVADQCMYGLKTWSTDKRQKDAAAQKKTRFVTNSESISNNLKKKCDGSHKHQGLL